MVVCSHSLRRPRHRLSSSGRVKNPGCTAFRIHCTSLLARCRHLRPNQSHRGQHHRWTQRSLGACTAQPLAQVMLLLQLSNPRASAIRSTGKRSFSSGSAGHSAGTTIAQAFCSAKLPTVSMACHRMSINAQWCDSGMFSVFVGSGRLLSNFSSGCASSIQLHLIARSLIAGSCVDPTAQEDAQRNECDTNPKHRPKDHPIRVEVFLDDTPVLTEFHSYPQ